MKLGFFRNIFLAVSKVIMPFLWNSEYLQGRWFENDRLNGYIWCWRSVLFQKILRKNIHVPWPCSHRITITTASNIIFDVNDLNNFQTFGCYFQSVDHKIVLGSGVYIAPNVGLITVNHDLYDIDKHTLGGDIIIGDNVWIGMNSVLLPGVIIGNNTIIGAGSVVTKSFQEGYCVVAGNPAKIIRKLNYRKCE